MKLKKFTVRNFQSIADLTIDFKPNGVYMFTGLNNIGKSAFLSAMDAHFYNSMHQTFKKDFIRDGSSSFETESESYDGYKVFQSRGADNYYQVTNPDGTKNEPLVKLERSVPEEVAGLFDFYTDPVSKEKINYRSSDSNLLLVHTSPKETYDIWQYAIKTTEISESIDRSNKLINENRSELEKLAVKLNSLQDSIDGIVVLDLEQYEPAIEKLKELDATLISCTNIVQQSVELDKIESGIKNIEDNSNMYAKIKELKGLLSILDSIEHNFIELDKIESRLSDINDIKSKHSKLSELSKVYKLVDSYVSHSEELDNINSRLTPVGVADDLNKAKKMAVALSHSNNILDLMSQFKDITEQINSKKEQLSSIDKEKNGLFVAYGYCPTCRTKFSGEHSHGEVK